MDSNQPHARGPRGQGTQRERRPGVWEVRIALDRDPVTGRTRHRSITVHGTNADATTARRDLLAELIAQGWGQGSPRRLPPAPLITVADLLPAWLAADHPWKPSTVVGYRSVVKALLTDPIAQLRVVALSPRVIRDHVDRWTRAGASPAVAAARFRVLRSAVGWAWDERIIDVHPVRFMRGPARFPPRRPLPDDQIRALLATAELTLLEAHANHVDGHDAGRLHRAEQNLLLVRLAADSGARRGELAALRIDDLDGRVLRIDKAFSAGVLTTPKSGHGRVLTLGATTAELWHTLAAGWVARAGGPVGPWLFAADPDHHHPLGADASGNRFDQVRDVAGVPDATLHRLRHSVATFLVSRGLILEAQSRLGHGDASTTLREYAYAFPLTDGTVADALDDHLNQPRQVDEPELSNADELPGEDR